MGNPLFNTINNGNVNHQLQDNIEQLKQSYAMFKNMGNPRQVMQLMAKRNPRIQPILEMLNNGGNPEQIFRNMAKQQGINPDEFIKQFQ